MTRLLDKSDFSEIISLLRNKEVVAFPTDTVFGIGVIYNEHEAVARMKQVKGRDEKKPFPLMAYDLKEISKLAYVGERERRIAAAFMPGAITLVLRRKDTLDRELVNGFDTVAVRIPDDEYLLRILKEAGPMFVTSANLSGQPAANNDQEVLAQLDGRLAAVLKGEAGSHVASTIIDCSTDELKCLREGEIPFAEIVRITEMKEDILVEKYIEKELLRQRRNIELIASENFASEAVMKANGSILTNKYAEGYPGRRYYGGCVNVDEIEDLARQRLCQLFGAEHANVQPHSGSQANMAVYFTVLNPGDTVLGMDLASGGHLTHGHPLSFSGRLYHFESYGVNKETELIDYDELAAKAREFRPKLIVSGASAYPRFIDYKRIREICDEVGALMMVDMAHVAGLIAAGLHPSPVPYADFVTSTTHKTLRGPRGGLVLCREEYANALDRAVFPGIQGGPLCHVIAGKAICFYEAQQKEFVEYQKQVVANAKALCDALKQRGFRIVSGGTDNHMVLLDVKSSFGITGKQLESALDEVNITVNKNAIPFDEERPAQTSGIRIGTPAMTTRGFKEADFVKVAQWIGDIACHIDDDAVKEQIRKEVALLMTDHRPEE